MNRATKDRSTAPETLRTKSEGNHTSGILLCCFDRTPHTLRRPGRRCPALAAAQRSTVLSHPVFCTTTNVDTNTHHFIMSGRFGPPTALDAFGSRIGRLMSTTTGYQADPYCFESDVPFSMPMTNDAVRETTWAYLARRARSPRNRITAPVGR